MSEGFWRTGITDVKPGEIRIQGYSIQDLIKHASFGDVVFLLFKGEWPLHGEGRLVEAILVSSADHSLAAPSADATRLVASCGVPLPSAVAAGVLAIGDYHAGAIEGCARTLLEGLSDEETDLGKAAAILVNAARERKERILGYGHPVHKTDPRVTALFEIAHELKLDSRWVPFALEVEKALEEKTGRHLPLNVDGAIAALLLEMGMDWRVGKAFFVISRSAGLAAHYLEQVSRERPFKAAKYNEIIYDGPPPRDLPVVRKEKER
ncbi:MAG: citryl-CoA lyase [Anaerolineaceae bacterium]|nr:citryl-CoA lyase [Anaerolineaceae bacterium]